jgi:hypothetical protein
MHSGFIVSLNRTNAVPLIVNAAAMAEKDIHKIYSSCEIPMCKEWKVYANSEIGSCENVVVETMPSECGL